MKLFAATLMVVALSLCATASAAKDFRHAFHTVALGRGRLLCNHEVDCAGELACIPQQAIKSGSSNSCGARSTSGLCNGYEDCGKGKAKTRRCVGNNHTHAG